MTIVPAILTLNSGSSSIKFSVYSIENSHLERLYSGTISNILKQPTLKVKSFNQPPLEWDNSSHAQEDPYKNAIYQLLSSLPKMFEIIAVGHRVVHGGQRYRTPTIINDECFKYLETLIPLAPLHQPYNVNGVRVLRERFPELPQVACFDTEFHTTCDELAQQFALPKALTDRGIRRYGFHGLSYEFIVSQFDRYLPHKERDGKIIVAHLGSGSSICAIHERKSVAVSIGFSTLDGLPMGTRCGSIDPGVLLYLMDHDHMDPKALTNLLYNESGWLGVSGGISSEMKELLDSPSEDAKRAVDLYVYYISRWIGSLAAALQGLDAIIFTAGVGENAPYIRECVCERSKWLGLLIDKEKNQRAEISLHHPDSKVSIYRIPTDEEHIIAKHTFMLARK